MKDSGVSVLLFIAVSLVAAFMSASGRPLLVKASAVYHGAVALLLLGVSAYVLFGTSWGSDPLFAVLGAVLMAFLGQRIGAVAIGDWKRTQGHAPSAKTGD